jgi:hypothetical protein
MTKKTDRKSKLAEPAKARKLTLKKGTLKDLTAPARGQQVKAGASSGGGGNTYYC